jgi:uncharacterized membrane protein
MAVEIPAAPPAASAKTVTFRVESIDLLRGLVMILMALDHVRDYFHADAFLYNPLDLDKTSPALFATRWVTHFCAPVFVFLAGSSAYLVGLRKEKNELSMFLLKRGLWLLILEFTVINFSWFFNLSFDFIALTVIWALGMGMIIMSAMSRASFNVVLVTGLVLVAGHNFLDPVHIGEQGSTVSFFWSLLHEANIFQLGHFLTFVGYPILPWAGVMMLGYCFGKLYAPGYDATQRKKVLVRLGLGMIILFAILRVPDVYGEPHAWTTQSTPLYTFLSIINVTKYPPSLLYVLATLGPAMLFLRYSENLPGKIAGYVTALGRVPLFFYVVHIFVIHLLAVFAALAVGFELSDMVFDQWVTDSPNLKGYGFSLGATYMVWVAIVLALFPLCVWYDRYKRHHREKEWLSYL